MKESGKIRKKEMHHSLHANKKEQAKESGKTRKKVMCGNLDDDKRVCEESSVHFTKIV